MAGHLKKTVSFAVLHFSVAFGVTYALTGDWRISGAVALIEPCVNTVAFFFHELFWSRRQGAQAQPKHGEKSAPPLLRQRANA